MVNSPHLNQPKDTLYALPTYLASIHTDSIDKHPEPSINDRMQGIKNLIPGQSEPDATDDVCAMCPSMTYQQVRGDTIPQIFIFVLIGSHLS